MSSLSFSDILNKASVFKNKNVLSPHYYPPEMLYRDHELRTLMELIAPAFKGVKPNNLFIYGNSGCGKTAAVKLVLQKIKAEENTRVFTTYMNCRVYDSRYKVIQKLVGDFIIELPRTGHSMATIYEKLLDWIEDDDQGKNLIVVLDEIDAVKDLDDLVYTLTRTNDDLKKGSISVIGISNRIDFKKKLDARSKSSLCEKELVFHSYNASQLSGILEDRIKASFNDGAILHGALNLASAIAASENGDVRYALSLLLWAGELADSKKLKVVTEKEVEDARKKADEDKSFELVSGLPQHQQLVLYALCLSDSEAYSKLVEENGDKYYFSGHVYEKYKSICRKTKVEPRSSRWYREYLHDLESLGLITTIESGKGVRGHATLICPGFDPNKIRVIIEKRILGD
ncbi:ORC1-type DNA replication protein [uncultured archaeon]|nr:ORC1-type DNA replication protein [uncultured archaeon]